ncbi:MAG: NAD-dependent epimerase/dehydratase family protein [Thermoplasmata archaeon]
MRIAVTGSSGQIGSRLFARLAESHEVRGFDRRPDSHSIQLDIGTPDAIPVLKGFDAIYHLAASIFVTESVANPPLYVRDNIVGTVNVLEAARQGDGRVVFVSSAAVYGEPQHLPIPESHPTKAMSPYGQTKITGEEFAQLYHDLYGLVVSIVRPFNVYSEDIKPDNPYAGVIATFIRNARMGDPLVIDGDGGQTRDFVHVSDVVQLLELLIRHKGDADVYNCGTGGVTTILDLAEMVRNRFSPTISIVHGPPRLGDIRHIIADITRARGIGYEPHVFLSDWIQRTPLAAFA